MKEILSESVMEQVGKMLAKNYGITVICCGTMVRTDKKTIYLPEMPHEMTPRLLSLVRSYLDHEVGHIVGDSDDASMDRMVAKHGELGRSMINSLEDIRVELLMSERWAGCEINLHSGNEIVFERIEERGVEGVARDRLLAVSCFTRGKMGRYQTGVPQDIRDIVESFSLELETIGSWAGKTSDLEPLADKIIEAYKAKDEEKKDGEDEKEENEDDTDGDGGGDDSGDSDSDSDSDGDSGDSDSDDSAVDGGEDGGNGAADTGSGTNSESQQPAAVASGPKATFGNSGGVNQELSAEMFEELGNNSGTLGEKLPWDGDSTRVFAAEVVAVSQRSRADFIKRAKEITGSARQRLLMMLESEARVGFRSGVRTGRIDSSRVAALASGISDRVMRRKADEDAPATACILLVDQSGSMSDSQYGISRIKAASMTAAAFCYTLESAGHASMVVGYTGRQVMLVKDWKHKFISRIPAFIAMRHMGSTPTGQAIEWARRSLNARSEQRRVLLVLTDGCPDDPKLMRQAMGRCKATGVEVAVIGINTGTYISENWGGVDVTSDKIGVEAMVALKKALKINTR